LLDFIIDKHTKRIINISNDVINEIVTYVSGAEEIECLDWLYGKHCEGALKIVITETTLNECLISAAFKKSKELLQWWCDKHDKSFIKINEPLGKLVIENLRTNSQCNDDIFFTRRWFLRFYYDKIHKKQ
jgi:hypothetical protein